MFDKLQNLVPAAAVKYGFSRQFRAIQICQEYRNLAPKLLPKGALEHSSPQSYKDSVLTIAVYNSLWAEQITMKKHLFLEALNQKFGPHTIKNIRVKICDEVDNP
jgi:hypothetical protein